MTNKRFTKQDVQFHSDHSRVHPAVNIKWSGGAWFDWGSLHDFRTGKLPHEYPESDYPEFWAWFDSLEDDEREQAFQTADECVREDVYGQFKEEACELLGIRDDDAWQEGRQGGWFVFDYKLNHDNWGHHVIESWDAIDLGKYRKIVKYADAYTERGGECDYQFLWHLVVNVFEAIERREAERANRAAKREQDEMTWTMELLAV